MKITFEELTERHLPRVLEIYTYYVLNSTATFQIKPSDPDGMREIALAKDRRHPSFVIQADGIICGYVLLSRFKPREAFDNTAEVTIYLDNVYAGKGIGGKALRFIESCAIKQQFHLLVALISGENDGSIRLFEKSGYEKCACFTEAGYKFDRWVDLVCCQKRI